MADQDSEFQPFSGHGFRLADTLMEDTQGDSLQCSQCSQDTQVIEDSPEYSVGSQSSMVPYAPMTPHAPAAQREEVGSLQRQQSVAEGVGDHVEKESLEEALVVANAWVMQLESIPFADHIMRDAEKWATAVALFLSNEPGQTITQGDLAVKLMATFHIMKPAVHDWLKKAEQHDETATTKSTMEQTDTTEPTEQTDTAKSPKRRRTSAKAKPKAKG